MNTQDAIVLMRKMEAAWPNIFAKNQDREKLYLDELSGWEYSQGTKAVANLIGEQKIPPAIAELRQELQKTKNADLIPLQPQSVSRPGFTTENKRIASHAQAKAAFARGYRKAIPDATQSQIEQIFGNMKYGEQDQETF